MAIWATFGSRLIILVTSGVSFERLLYRKVDNSLVNRTYLCVRVAFVTAREVLGGIEHNIQIQILYT